MKTFSLTARANGIGRDVQTECEVSPGFDPVGLPPDQHFPYASFRAIWDTGATNSVISQAVVQACGLQPIGMVRVSGVHGFADAEQFLVNFRLPGPVTIRQVLVTRGNLGPNCGALIGMDIITLGDFAITNVGGVTVFSFRIPSTTTIDYVKEQNGRNRWAGGQRGTANPFQGGRMKPGKRKGR